MRQTFRTVVAMADNRTEDQKVAAVAASMAMDGQPLSAETDSEGRRILRGETSADQSVLELLERHGYGDSSRAAELRRRLGVSERNDPYERLDELARRTTKGAPELMRRLKEYDQYGDTNEH